MSYSGSLKEEMKLHNNHRGHNDSMAVAFLGSVLPDGMCHRSPACSMAGNKFQIKFLHALKEASGVTPSIFSVLPAGVYPKSQILFVRSKSIDLDPGLKCRIIPFVNILFFKQMTIGLVNFFYLLRWFWHHHHMRHFVLVCNVYPPMSLPVILSTKLFRGKAVAIVPDFPHNLSFDFKGWRGILQRINVWVEARILAYFDGIIPLTRYIVEDFAPGSPMMVMEGGVDLNDFGSVLSESVATSPELICLFSGALNEINGINLLLEAFRLIQNPKFRLWIFGSGPLEAAVREASLIDNRIVYWGYLPNSDVMRHQRYATVLLNVRPTDQKICRYTFPSKLCEYMLSGRPVITTALPGIPKEYFDFVYVLLDETPEALARLIVDICAKPASELCELGHRAQEFLLKSKSWTKQGKRVYGFIRNI
jgi:glycosyltransferase involved in cell wall biosynthesis